MRSGLTGLLAFFFLAGCHDFQRTAVDWGDRGHSFFTHDGGRVHYLERGSGPPVLFVHGFGSALVVWDEVAEPLCRDHRCLFVDLPGFGLSDKHERDYRPAALAATLVALLDHAGVRGPVDVVAHSWGSSLALALALDHPDRVHRLVLTAAWVYEQQLPSFFEWARVPGLGEMLWDWFYTEQAGYKFAASFHDPDRFATPEVVDRIEAAFDRPGAVRASLESARGQEALREMQTRYSGVPHRALLVWGADDTVSFPSFGERLAADLPHARLERIARCGHLPMVEQPRRYAALVRDFLAANGGAP